MSQVQALYDFYGQDVNELTIQAGELLTLVLEYAGEGWSKARNDRGEEGLIPAAYVETFVTEQAESAPPLARGNVQQPVTQVDNDDYWDDSDASDDDHSQQGAVASVQMRANAGQASRVADSAMSRTSAYSDNARFSTVRKAFGRSFAKGGGEEFLLGLDNIKVVVYEAVIEETSDGLTWKRTGEVYDCQISSSKKESKMKGIKSFVAYHVTPSFSGIQVSRRYKQFDWLHKRISEKYPCICVPPLPDKQITGRYEEDFIETRRRQLRLWLNRVCAHPVLTKSRVLSHFLTCTDDGKKWKTGKREAEKDPLHGAKFFYAVSAPTKELDWSKVKDKLERMDTFVTEMDKSNRILLDTLQQFNRKIAGPISKEYSRIGEAFAAFSFSLDLDPDEKNNNLVKAIGHTGQTYESIGFMFSQQPQQDGDKLCDELQLFTGLFCAVPGLLQLQRGALTSVTESRRADVEDKISKDDVETIRQRAHVIAHAVSAETLYLHQDRTKDLNSMMRAYLGEQISFYRAITDKLEKTLELYK